MPLHGWRRQCGVVIVACIATGTNDKNSCRTPKCGVYEPVMPQCYLCFDIDGNVLTADTAHDKLVTSKPWHQCTLQHCNKTFGGSLFILLPAPALRESTVDATATPAAIPSVSWTFPAASATLLPPHMQWHWPETSSSSSSNSTATATAAVLTSTPYP